MSLLGNLLKTGTSFCQSAGTLLYTAKTFSTGEYQPDVEYGTIYSCCAAVFLSYLERLMRWTISSHEEKCKYTHFRFWRCILQHAKSHKIRTRMENNYTLNRTWQCYVFACVGLRRGKTRLGLLLSCWRHFTAHPKYFEKIQKDNRHVVVLDWSTRPSDDWDPVPNIN